MLVRQLTSLSEAKYLVLIIILLSLALGFFLGRGVDELLLPSENLEQAPSVITPIDPPLKSKSEDLLLLDEKKKQSPDADSIKSDKSEKKSDIKKLMDEQISNETRKIINERLLSNVNQYEFTKTEDGGRRHRNDRWSAVAISLIDENGNALMVDITSPLPLLEGR
jgi:hypothetical protein